MWKKVDIAEKVTVVDLVDEINLTEIPATVQEEEVESDLFTIIGEYRDWNFKPFSVIELEKESKLKMKQRVSKKSVKVQRILNISMNSWNLDSGETKKKYFRFFEKFRKLAKWD